MIITNYYECSFVPVCTLSSGEAVPRCSTNPSIPFGVAPWLLGLHSPFPQLLVGKKGIPTYCILRTFSNIALESLVSSIFLVFYFLLPSPPPHTDP